MGLNASIRNTDTMLQKKPGGFFVYVYMSNSLKRIKNFSNKVVYSVLANFLNST